MVRTAVPKFGYILVTNRCFKTSWGTPTAHDANEAHAEDVMATAVPIAPVSVRNSDDKIFLTFPKTVNWTAPNGKANKLVETEPATNLLIPNSLKVFAPWRV